MGKYLSKKPKNKVKEVDPENKNFINRVPSD